MFSSSRANYTESDTPPPPRLQAASLLGRSLLKLPLPWTGFEGPQVSRSVGASRRFGSYLRGHTRCAVMLWTPRPALGSGL